MVSNRKTHTCTTYETKVACLTEQFFFLTIVLSKSFLQRYECKKRKKESFVEYNTCDRISKREEEA